MHLNASKLTSTSTSTSTFNVYLKGKLIDTVFYDDDCDANYVRRGLVEHDGYASGITVRRDRKLSRWCSGKSIDPCVPCANHQAGNCGLGLNKTPKTCKEFDAVKDG